MSSAFSNINDAIRRVTISKKLSVSGRVSKYDGNFLECDGFPANLGSICSVTTDDGNEATAEIIGFNKGNNILSMFESDTKIQSGAKVSLIEDGHEAKVDLASLAAHGVVRARQRARRTAKREPGGPVGDE